MKKSIVACLVMSVVIFGTNSVAFSQSYFSGNLALVSVNDSDFSDGFDSGEFSFDNGVGFSVAIGGATAGGGPRLEVELAHRKNDFDSVTIYGYGSGSIPGDVTVNSLMGNGYVDFSSSGNFIPFIGAGLGFANVDASIDDFGSEDDTVVAYQLMIGGSFAGNTDLSFDIQYRLFGTEDPDFDGLEAEYSSHNFMVGFRKAF